MSPPRPKRAERGRPADPGLAPDEPRVAIVGCPNVGKSTLFNRIVGRRDAVVDAQPGVTRDRRQGGTEWRGRSFQLIDTGGIDESDESAIGRQVAEQAANALTGAELVLMVVDVASAPTAGDLDLVDRLRRLRAPMMLVANKCDSPGSRQQAANLASLGTGPPLAVSAVHGLGVGDLLDAIVERLDPPRRPEERPDRPAICVIGRPNVGKSSIVNALLGEERVLVHERPGTTRDPIDTLIEVNGREVVLIDTAGLRRVGRTREAIEQYSQGRALRAAARSDVAIVVCDATAGVTDTDLAAAEEAAKANCATLIAVNKWDLAQPDIVDLAGRIARKVRQRPPIEVCSAVSREGLHRLLPSALRLAARRSERLPTSKLNDLLRALAAERPGPRKGRAQLSLRYIVQVAESPPRIRVDVNDRGLVTRDYGFWLENRIRSFFGLEGVPLLIEYRTRGE